MEETNGSHFFLFEWVNYSKNNSNFYRTEKWHHKHEYHGATNQPLKKMVTTGYFRRNLP